MQYRPFRIVIKYEKNCIKFLEKIKKLLFSAKNNFGIDLCGMKSRDTGRDTFIEFWKNDF